MAGGEPCDFSVDAFSDPRFELVGDGEILRVEAPRDSRTNRLIPVTIVHSPDRRSFTLTTNILNPRDRIAFTVYHTGAERALSASGRFRRQSDLELQYPTAKPITWWTSQLVSQIRSQNWYIAILLFIPICIWRLASLKGKLFNRIFWAYVPASAGTSIATLIVMVAIGTLDVPTLRINIAVMSAHALLCVCFVFVVMRLMARDETTQFAAWLLRLVCIPPSAPSESTENS